MPMLSMARRAEARLFYGSSGGIMRRLGLTIGLLGVAAAAAACGSSGAGTVPSQPAAPQDQAAVDHMRLKMMRLRLDDLGPNWRRDTPSDSSSKCESHPKNVTITAGQWKSKGVSYANGISTEIHSDAIVFATPEDAQKTVAHYTGASMRACLRREIRKALRHSDVKLRSATTSTLHRGQVADEFAGFRLTLNLEKGEKYYQYFFDTFFIRQDRAVAEFMYGSPYQPAPSGTEITLAKTIAQRGALVQ
jgi:hypothetical protein